MRNSNHAVRTSSPGALVLSGLVAAALVVLAGCGSPAPVASPSAPPTPVITPDPHLTAPVTADQIFRAIGRIELAFVANNATNYDPGEPVVKRINADLSNWPLIITEFRSAVDLRAVTGWDPSLPPVQGNPPFAFVAFNVMIEFGPSTGVRLEAPVPARQEQAEQLVAILDPLLWPLEQRSVVPVPTKTAPPAATVAPSATTGPSASGAPPSPSS
jgi:hypothetical protein